MSTSKFNIIKNVTPAVAIMLAGVAGAVFSLNGKVVDNTANTLSQIAPAAGVSKKADLFSGDLPPFPEAQKNTIEMEKETTEVAPQ